MSMQGISTPGDLIAGGLYYAYSDSGMREQRTTSSSVAAENKANQPEKKKDTQSTATRQNYHST